MLPEYLFGGPWSTKRRPKGDPGIYIYIYYIYKWHVCLGSYILEQEESRDIRKKGRVGEQGREEIR